MDKTIRRTFLTLSMCIPTTMVASGTEQAFISQQHYAFEYVRKWEEDFNKGKINKRLKRAIAHLIHESRKRSSGKFTELRARVTLSHQYDVSGIRFDKVFPTSTLLNGDKSGPKIKDCRSFSQNKNTGLLNGEACKSYDLSKKAKLSAWTALIWYANNVCAKTNAWVAKTRVQKLRQKEKLAKTIIQDAKSGFKRYKDESQRFMAEEQYNGIYKEEFQKFPPYGMLYALIRDHYRPARIDEVILILNIVYKDKKYINYDKSQLTLACHTKDTVLTAYQTVDDELDIDGLTFEETAYQPFLSRLNLSRKNFGK